MKFVLLAFVSLLLLSATLGTSFITQAAYEQTINSDSVDPFPQAGKFYTLAGRSVGWEIVEGEKTTYHEEWMDKWSVQDVDGDIAILNRTLAVVYIYPETGAFRTETYDLDYEIATDRTILSMYYREMYFNATGFESSWEGPIDMDIGEHIKAWFPTDLYIGALVPVGWTGDGSFLGDMLYEVVGEEVIQIIGEKQDCWMLRMPPSITIDGARVRTNTWWVDKETGVPLKAYFEEWALDGSWGLEEEDVLVHTNIDLGPESTQPPSPTYTLTFPTTPGFPEAGKFYTWYYLEEGWYMSGAINVTRYIEGLWTWFVAEVTDDVAVVNRIMWSERVCEAEGVGELEAVEIRYYSYRISTTTRAILDITGSGYGINMTSLSWWGWDITSLANDIGEKTYCWLPTNLYIGANVDITWTTDETLDNATYTVTDEKIISALGEPQACWALYLPLTTTVDGKSIVTETFYSDKDVGIALEYISKSEAVDGSSAYVATMRLMDTNVDLTPSFPQPGMFYTLAGRTVNWGIVDGKNTTSHDEVILKWSVQDVVGDVAFVNLTYVYFYIHPETGWNWTTTTDFDRQIATNRTILSAYRKEMRFTTAGFQWSASRPLDEDVGEHTWAWFPTDLYIGAYVLVSCTTDNSFLYDMLYEVVDEEVIQILGEKQDCWMVRMPPTITIDGARVCTETYWVDKDTGIPLKMYGKSWALDGSFGWEYEHVLVHTNIDLGPESTEPPSPTYTLTVPTTPGFPEAGKLYTWYILYEGWYMNGATNVTYYAEELLSCWVVNVTDNKALVYIIWWEEYLCEAQGVEELEYVAISYRVYSIDIATREILDVNGTVYVVNMTSLAYGGPWDETPLLAGDIGEETYCWLPTNLYIGAAVNITCTTDRPWKVDNGTYTVVDEEIISALGQPQACWVLYLPSTPSIDGTWNHSGTYYSDKDVGIPLECVGEGWAVNGSEAYKYTLQLIDTNIYLGPYYYLTITSTAGGTTDPLPGTHNYTAGSSLNVTAIPNPGYSFDHWLLDGEKKTENPITIVMHANHTLEAFFVDDIPPEIGVPTQEPPPENVTAYQNVTVTVNVTDLGTGVYNVTLWYNINNGITWTPLNMTEISANTYQATIPGYENCTWITYKIIAYDNNGNPATDDNHGYHYIYHVIPEFPATIILPLFIIATIVTIILRKTNWQKQHPKLEHRRTKCPHSAGSLSEDKRTLRNRQRP